MASHIKNLLKQLPFYGKIYCSNNKKVLGKMKDEYGGKSICRPKV